MYVCMYVASRNIRKEGNVLYNDALNILFTVILRQTYGKGPLRNCSMDPP